MLEGLLVLVIVSCVLGWIKAKETRIEATKWQARRERETREQEIAHARYVEEKRVAEANAAGAKAYRERWGHMSWRLP